MSGEGGEEAGTAGDRVVVEIERDGDGGGAADDLVAVDEDGLAVELAVAGEEAGVADVVAVVAHHEVLAFGDADGAVVDVAGGVVDVAGLRRWCGRRVGGVAG